jgi:hypothetical protein
MRGWSRSSRSRRSPRGTRVHKTAGNAIRTTNIGASMLDIPDAQQPSAPGGSQITPPQWQSSWTGDPRHVRRSAAKRTIPAVGGRP